MNGDIMKIIRDIRIYKSEIENIDGNSLPVSLGDKQLIIMIYRVVMKLREQGFSLGEFDHLYINLTTCQVEGKSALSKRSIDKYYQWYRYYDVNIDKAVYEQLGLVECREKVLGVVERVLVKHFATQSFGEEAIHACFEEAKLYGENMLMKFKEKTTSKRTTTIYLRLLDNGHYAPLLKVLDEETKLLLEADLPEVLDLDYIGEIQVSSKKVTIKPRKNAYTTALKLEPIIFEY